MAPTNSPARRRWPVVVLGAAAIAAVAVVVYRGAAPAPAGTAPQAPRLNYKPREGIDTSGFMAVVPPLAPTWTADSSLEQVAEPWRRAGYRLADVMEQGNADPHLPGRALILRLLLTASYYHYEGETERAYAVLERARERALSDDELSTDWLYTVVFYQGVTALRRGETDNCVMCRGESSCILPLSPAAVHTKPDGSRLAIKHFAEYLQQFPDDLEVRWLLNIAHMTLGEHPHKVDPRYLVSLDRYTSPEHGIGKFRDVGHKLGINRFNQAGGVILDDFDNDDRLDIVFTTMDPTQPMRFYHNKGDGTFEDRTEAAGLTGQLGGLNLMQADYDNDGNADIFITRGAWLRTPIRPTLLRNNGNGTFTDVTVAAGMLAANNSITAQWADYDNDGFLDLFVCCETGPNRLYRNRGNGTFEEVAARAGVSGGGADAVWKGAAWIDYDGDRYPDLFLTDLIGAAHLFHNDRDGRFTEVTAAAGIDGPQRGFSCWAWDYDNDGWPDLFATSYDRTVADVVRGLIGEPHTRHTNKLYRNLGGKGFQDVTAEAGLPLVFSAMGSNFGDFDNDGFLDFYLGTGDPGLSTLVPNRMLRNLGGRRFVDITGSSGTGHLQKGHGVACGDWDRNGSADILIEMGGAINGDKYHNVMFQNPGQGNNWLNVKLVGGTSNRSAIGARIKAVTAGPNPRTVCRWVSSGSSFGANPLEQILGLGKAERVATLEVYWPTSDTTQVFRDLPANQFLEITERAAEYRKRDLKPIALEK